MRTAQVGKPEGKRALEKPRCRQENIKIDLQEVGGDRDWIDLAHNRDDKPPRAVIYGEFC